MSKTLQRRAGDAPQRFVRRLLVPLVSLLMVMLALLIGVQLWATVEQDRLTALAEARAATGAVARRQAVMRTVAYDYANWDDAFQHLHRELDPAWADGNIGEWATAHQSIDLCLVIGPDGEVRYAADADGRAAAETVSRLTVGFAELVREARRQVEDAPVSGLVMADGTTPAIVVASRIEPSDSATVMPAGDASLLIYVDLLDAPTITRFARDYGLGDLRLAAIRRKPVVGDVVLATRDGQPLARMAWQGSRPGRAVLARVLPLTGFTFLSAALLVAAVATHARTTATALMASRDLAERDSLTGLPNRRSLDERLDAALADRRGVPGSLAVLYLDLDGFKAVNDQLGHAAGDCLLTIVADRLVAIVTQGATIARLGGDEFVLVAPDCAGPNAAIELAERLIAAVHQPISLDHGALRDGLIASVGLSIGIAFARPDDVSAADLLRRADEALYRAKQAGRGRWCLAETATPPPFTAARAWREQGVPALA